MGIEFGPMSLDDLAGLIQRGNLRPSDPVRNSQDGTWIKAEEVAGLVHRAAGSAPEISEAQAAVTASGGAAGGRGTTATHRDAPAAWKGEPVGENHSLALDQYNCAILIGPGGVSICDLRDCQRVVVAGARVVGHRSADDDAPIRFGPLELQISVREVGERVDPQARGASVTETGEPAREPATVGSAVEPGAEPSIESPIPSVSSKRANTSKAVPKGNSPAETEHIAAETLRRMFMPRPTKAR